MMKSDVASADSGFTLALIGMGLMGASIAMAVRERNLGWSLRGSARRLETRDRCMEMGLLDVCCEDPAEAVQGADFVVLCTPVRTIPRVLEKALPGLKPGAVITDVGSTKSWLIGESESVLAPSAAPFVGSHPMCGSEQTGVDAGRADLYEGACCIVVPGDSTATKQVAAFWRALGSSVCMMSAEEHDVRTANSSHMPHLAASSIVSAATKGCTVEQLSNVCGSGFRDTTRVASGSPSVWRDIVETNSEAVVLALRTLEAEISAVATLLENNHFEAVETFLATARDVRNELMLDRCKRNENQANDL